MEGVERVVEALRHHGKKHRNVRFAVVYSDPKAIYVHENLQARHTVGQAKFLEQPARTQGNTIAAACRQAMKPKDATLEDGLRASAEKLLALSLPLVPVDTGFLKASGHIRKEAIA